ncbi:hypothetical protein C8N32_11344 [Rhodovulum imhoffii]|uniref:Uncharacterized protein n=1 Tax=Rhodovulum imhoffii TaxID=365340 RepID=A0A2T5BQJ2_9RHOB|nr:hypothetical protein [Rhodovulum imhoffii]MBK5934289.1 hypothetical protein [Rhodovulum imhoffii]PTN01435.1 hypothetical protein C8N32_11344 [Rhodovulum imhoffii]
MVVPEIRSARCRERVWQDAVKGGSVLTTRLIAVSLVWAALSGAGMGAETPFVAGTAPDSRPEGAPTITETAKDSDWYAEALAGVEAPYPYSLRFLEDQGGWFTPFTRPGMTGPYDIREMH